MSGVHKVVSDHLSAMKVRHESEKRTADGHMTLDILLLDKVGDRVVVVEVDGPVHFLGNTGEPTGRTLLRNRLLEARGLEVVSLPWAEWPHYDRDAQRAYLEKKARGGGEKERRLRLPQA